MCKQTSDQLTADEISLKFETSVKLYCHPVFEVQGQLIFGSLTKNSCKTVKNSYFESFIVVGFLIRTCVLITCI